jgi:hypothetical protein
MNLAYMSHLNSVGCNHVDGITPMENFNLRFTRLNWAFIMSEQFVEFKNNQPKILEEMVDVYETYVQSVPKNISAHYKKTLSDIFCAYGATHVPLKHRWQKLECV